MVERDGLRVTGPSRTLYDILRRSALPTAVAVLDAMARLHGVDPAAVQALTVRYPRARGRSYVASTLPLADPDSPTAAISMVRAELDWELRERARVAPVLEVAGRAVRPALVWDAEQVAVFAERDTAAAQRGIALLSATGWWIAPADAAAIPHVLARARAALLPWVALPDEEVDVDEWDGQGVDDGD